MVLLGVMDTLGGRSVSPISRRPRPYRAATERRVCVMNSSCAAAAAAAAAGGDDDDNMVSNDDVL